TGAIMVLTSGAVMLIRLLELIGPFGRASQRARKAGRHLAEAIGLHHPATLAHALAALGVLLLVAINWLHADLLQAATASFNSAPLAMLLPMSEQTAERNTYQNELTLVLCLMGFSLYKIQQLRHR